MPTTSAVTNKQVPTTVTPCAAPVQQVQDHSSSVPQHTAENTPAAVLLLSARTPAEAHCSSVVVLLAAAAGGAARGLAAAAHVRAGLTCQMRCLLLAGLKASYTFWLADTMRVTWSTGSCSSDDDDAGKGTGAQL